MVRRWLGFIQGRFVAGSKGEGMLMSAAALQPASTMPLPNGDLFL